MLSCGALGEPVQRFEWRKNGSVLLLGVTAEINITITSAFSGGDYECLTFSGNRSSSIITTVNGMHIR